MRIIFMGTPLFAVPSLQTLIDAGHDVIAVYAQPARKAGRGMKLTPSPVEELARKYAIPVFTPTKLTTQEAQAEFAAHCADIAVVAAYGLLLPQAILDAPGHGCINIHPSDLPRWRGAAPLQRTIMAGDTTTACCIMQMDAGLDTGAVILREQFPMADGMNFGHLHDAMARIGASLLLDALAHIADGTATRTPQPADGIYAAKITKDDQRLNFELPAHRVRQHILGLAPTPGALAQLGTETVKIFDARIATGDATQPAGVLLDDQLRINCGHGSAIIPTQLQRAGKSRQDTASFLQGFPVPTGGYATLPKK